MNFERSEMEYTDRVSVVCFVSINHPPCEFKLQNGYTPFSVVVTMLVVSVEVVACTVVLVVVVVLVVPVVVVALKLDFQHSILHKSSEQHLLHAELRR